MDCKFHLQKVRTQNIFSCFTVHSVYLKTQNVLRVQYTANKIFTTIRFEFRHETEIHSL